MKKPKYLFIISFLMLTMMVSNVFAIRNSIFNDNFNRNDNSDNLRTSEYIYIDNFSKNEFNDKLDIKFSNNKLNIEVKLNSSSVYYIALIYVSVLPSIYVEYYFLNHFTTYYKDDLSIPISFSKITVNVHLAHFINNHIVKHSFLNSTIFYNKTINQYRESNDLFSRILRNDENLLIITVLSSIICLFIAGIFIYYYKLVKFN